MANTANTANVTGKGKGAATAAYKAAEAAFAGLLVDLAAARDNAAKATGEICFYLVSRAFDAGKQTGVPERMRELFAAHNERAKANGGQPLAQSYIKQVAAYAGRLCALTPAQWAQLVGTGSKSLQGLYKKAGETFPEVVKKTGKPKDKPEGETSETSETSETAPKTGKADFAARLSEAMAAISRLKSVASNPATLEALAEIVDALHDLDGLPG